MVNAAKRRATYQDVLDAPAHLVAEIIGGELRLSPRPGGPHTAAASRLGHMLGPSFDLGTGGPGGWIVLDEPELHLEDDIVVPDLAGWRVERMAAIPGGAFFSVPPDWVCEVLSRSTAVNDRTEKLPIYARAGLGHAWLVNAITRTLEVFVAHAGAWQRLALHRGEGRVRVPPFEAIELDLARLWPTIAPVPPRGTHAAEEAAEYFVGAADL